MTETEAQMNRAHRRLRSGVVVSDRCDKTIKVTNEWTRKHPKYGKILRRRTTLHVHDPQNQAKVGDIVEVMACRPVSKQKSWRLVRIVTPAKSAVQPA